MFNSTYPDHNSDAGRVPYFHVFSPVNSGIKCFRQNQCWNQTAAVWSCH